MRPVNRSAAAEFAAIGWVFRCAGALLFAVVAVATGALGWLLTHPTGGETVLAVAGIPSLAGLLAMSIDMMSDMALSRRLLSPVPRASRGERYLPIVDGDGACTGS